MFQAQYELEHPTYIRAVMLRAWAWEGPWQTAVMSPSNPPPPGSQQHPWAASRHGPDASTFSVAMVTRFLDKDLAQTQAWLILNTVKCGLINPCNFSPDFNVICDIYYFNDATWFVLLLYRLHVLWVRELEFIHLYCRSALNCIICEIFPIHMQFLRDNAD